MKQTGTIAVVVIFLLVVGIWWSNSLSSSDPDLISKKGIHWHPEVEIYIKGEKQEIPEGLGLAGVHNPIHTHDDVPAIHMEFGGRVTNDNTRLGNFFDIWGETFNSEQIFEYVNGPEGSVSMTVNGEPNTEFEDYLMKDGDKIEIRYE